MINTFDEPTLIMIIIFMGLVTYIPRVLPIVLLKEVKLSPFWNSFFQYMPYCALSALIFPNVLYSTDSMTSAIFGAIIAIILAYKRVNVIIVIFGAILGVYIFQNFLSSILSL
ncbi:AzlD domain-containing protein [Methanococcus voltae]|uniref:Branched-subunit amino acid transport protein n=2 Tax=Methanococcus voltae TaxID=2188 RepID=A0A8J7USQ9_METVO|nr:AzlD domain-containing protein [Methanococcus voltae]MBP2173032.1 branched-subunit amino acid transport protein [Methanococcus voltae]MBP2201912.1 branched-subunit amino acid transport protein [Methanococcus voltae]MCS3922076.1 branched-subunit amino acid transport protein [Methanococcus voltae PS]